MKKMSYNVCVPAMEPSIPCGNTMPTEISKLHRQSSIRGELVLIVTTNCLASVALTSLLLFLAGLFSLKAVCIITIATSIVSYVTSFCLHGTIYYPILQLMEDSLHAAKQGNYSARIHTFRKNEIGHIVDSLNNILEERERTHNEFSEKAKALQAISHKSDLAIKHFNKEFRNPFNAINSFQTLLKDQAFGPVNPMYFEYFKDVCNADIELYCSVTRVMELYRIQSQIFNEGQTPHTVASLVDKLTQKYMGQATRNFTFTSAIVGFSPQQSVKAPLEAFSDNIMSLFLADVREKGLYTLQLTFRKERHLDKEHLILHAEMRNALELISHVNDNFYSTNLQQLIDCIRNSEHPAEIATHKTIDFNSMVVRGKINMLDFLAGIYNSTVTTSISAGKLAFTVTMDWDDAAASSFLRA